MNHTLRPMPWHDRTLSQLFTRKGRQLWRQLRALERAYAESY